MPKTPITITTKLQKYLKNSGWEVHDGTLPHREVWTLEGRFYVDSGGRHPKEFNREEALILEGYFCKSCTDKYWAEKRENSTEEPSE